MGAKTPNPWGLYAMHGNVWEWCRDNYVEKLPGGEDPEVITGHSNRVFRGGCWNNSARFCRAAFRIRIKQTSEVHDLGFRVVLEK